MSQFSQSLRTKSIFQLLGASPDSSSQEEDLKMAEMGTLRQLLIDLKAGQAAPEAVTSLETALKSLESATGDTYATQLDALYASLNSQFADDLTGKLESAVEKFKIGILTGRVEFLREQMNKKIDEIFSNADSLLKSEDLEGLLGYLDEIQSFLLADALESAPQA